jgi:hypothetical protein
MVIFPVVAVAGTVTEIEVAELAVIAAGTPLNETTLFAGTLLKPVPVITTDEPTNPMLGEKEEMARGKATNSAVLVTVVASRVTEILPVVAPVGTVTVTLFSELAVTVAAVPLKNTC